MTFRQACIRGVPAILFLALSGFWHGPEAAASKPILLRLMGRKPVALNRPAPEGHHPAGVRAPKARSDRSPVREPGSDTQETEERRRGGTIVPERSPTPHEKRAVEGWTVWVNPRLLDGEEKPFTDQALALLAKQLAEIRRVVPAHHVKRLQEVPLWFNPPYERARPTAEYHPDAGWLRANHRNPAMARAVEFTNTRIWEAENRRMPMLVLHELAHAFHHRVVGA